VKNGSASDAALSKQTSRTTNDAEASARTPSKENDNLRATEDEATPLASPSPEVNPLWLQNGQSFLSWNMKEYASQALKKLSPAPTNPNNSSNLLRPEFTSQNSALTVVSRLSSEGSRTPDDGEGERMEKMETLRCRKCGRGTFKARTSRGKEGVEKVLVCQRCGTVAG
jgi:ribosomal protein L37E